MIGFDTNYFFTYLALVRRDLRVIRKRFRGALIDAGVQVMISVIVFGGLFPTMGVPTFLISPLFVGSIAMQLMFIGVGFGLRNVFDIKFTRFIDYRMTLPLPKRWLFASYITYFCMEASIVSVPPLTIGIVLLGPKFQIISPNWLLFIFVYLLTLILYGLLFLGMSLYYKFEWFMQNMWPRRFTFLLMLSPMFFVWYRVYEFAPRAAYMMLLSPLTYTAEGMRATLIGGPLYIPGLYCAGAIVFWIGVFVWFVSEGVKKRLDPV